MKVKKLVMVGLSVAVMAGAAGIASAQGPGRPDVPGGRGDAPGFQQQRRGGAQRGLDLVRFVADELGLTPRELAQQIRDGATLEEVITSNGKTVDEVVAAVIASVTEQVDTAVENGRIDEEQAATLLENLETRLTELISEGFDPRPALGRAADIRGTVVDSIVAATGIEAADLRDQLATEGTLAAVITANGGDVAAVTSAVIADLTEQINAALEAGEITEERAATMLENLAENVDAMLTHEFTGEFDRGFGRDGRPGARGGNAFQGIVMDSILEATGLTAQEIRQSLADGSTLPQILEEAGVDVTTLQASIQAALEENINAALEAGRIDEEQAADLLERALEHLDELLFTTRI